MTLQQAMSTIESLEFSAIVNVTSTYKTFLRLLASQPAIQELQNNVGQPDVARELLMRIQVLCAMPGEENLEHPADTALAAYLWLLSISNPESARVGAAAILKCRQCWWAKQVAKMAGAPAAARSSSVVRPDQPSENKAGVA